MGKEQARLETTFLWGEICWLFVALQCVEGWYEGKGEKIYVGEVRVNPKNIDHTVVESQPRGAFMVVHREEREGRGGKGHVLDMSSLHSANSNCSAEAVGARRDRGC